ncbi:glycosyltransferase family 4 protein, partial [bacterium]|nr:glycosyltransferase family 4 protein [bacterium]
LINLLTCQEFYAGFEKIYVFANASLTNKLKKIQLPNMECKYHPLLDKGLICRVFWQQRLLYKSLKRLKVNVLFCPGGIIPFLRPKHSKVITMCQNMVPFNLKESLHLGPDLRFLKFWLLQKIQLSSFKRAAGVIFISEYARQQVEKLLNRSINNCTCIYHGVNSEFERIRPKNTNPGKTTEILYVSTIDVYKHQWQVVKALPFLIDKGHHDIRLILIGSGYKKAVKKLNHTISMLRLKDKVTWKGYIDYKQLPNVYKKAHIFVFASSCENCPNILLEAMASGLPIACSNNPPMPEFAKDAVYYFDPLNHNSIAEAISQLLNNKDEASKLANRAYELSRQYSWKHTSQKTLDFINTFVNNNETN